ncbi:L,D-transpeptidase [uncultured Pseudoteredinibacter sp.]|uniref:L,D-transpeptidase n=1 Tax=uncultured Pseudoteredinibacter sp. TaxID=1641701 RepID=UPI002621F014|nr:L,D-transpeptidase [uncultured Pseudoteredinibacter sp.]
MNDVLTKYLQDKPELSYALLVSVVEQSCYLFDRDGKLLRSYAVSTAQRGISSQEGSFGTPTGLHCIRERIGADMPLGMCFKGRQATGEIACIENQAPPCRTEGDFILSRIMWLEGLEPGVNQGQGIDSHERYIYIHGTNEEYLIGQAASHGCIRMRNHDVIELFDLLLCGTPVYIQA